MSQRTILYDRHLAAGGRMVDFAGWEMPVQYTGILDEHRAVRESCGVFDISHMGEFLVTGAEAGTWLDGILTNRVAALDEGRAQYTLLLNEKGGIIDDLIVYRTGTNEYLLVVNASKREEDAAWLKKHLAGEVHFEDVSADYAALAVQGPGAASVYEKVFARTLPEKRNAVCELPCARGRLFAVTTGYTGEPGFEILLPGSEAGKIWDKLLALEVKPCGLGARDTLRLEMCYPLNGADLSPEHTPVESGLGFAVDWEKPAFPGRETALRVKSEGPKRRLMAVQVEGKSPPLRPHYPVLHNGEKIGETTSGALSPSLGVGIAMTYLPIALAKIGQDIEIEIRGRRYRASVVKKPFYQKNS